MRKPTFCVCDDEDADQLRGNREADQRLCFRHLVSTIQLLHKVQYVQASSHTAWFVSDLVRIHIVGFQSYHYPATALKVCFELSGPI